jgi:hypothetical protein
MPSALAAAMVVVAAMRGARLGAQGIPALVLSVPSTVPQVSVAAAQVVGAQGIPALMVSALGTVAKVGIIAVQAMPAY